MKIKNMIFKKIILVSILIIILCLLMNNVKNEKFTDIFYKSEIRLRDYQDILSTTESEIKKLKNKGIS
jgi:peptidoglycan hydrolase CwlO-like protein